MLGTAPLSHSPYYQRRQPRRHRPVLLVLNSRSILHRVGLSCSAPEADAAGAAAYAAVCHRATGLSLLTQLMQTAQKRKPFQSALNRNPRLDCHSSHRSSRGEENEKE